MNSVVIDVAIGMSFVYLLLSLIASVVQEMLATFMQMRPANLQHAIQSLLSGNSIQADISLVDSIYNHGLVRGLYSDPKMDLSKIPPPQAAGMVAAAETQVVSALTKIREIKGTSRPFDWLRNLLRRLFKVQPAQPVVGVSNQLLLPAYIPSVTFAMAMIDLLNRNKASGETAMREIREFLAAHHYQFRDNKATEAMLTLANDAQGDLKKFQANLEAWYSAAMDRASGWYKKKTQYMLLIIGIILAASLNVDSIKVAKTLWSDRDARQAMVDAASQYISNHPSTPAPDSDATPKQPADPSTKADPDPKTAPTADAEAPANTDSDGKTLSASELKSRMDTTVEQFSKVANSALLPVGWKNTFGTNLRNTRHSPKDAFLMALPYVPGWLITALAISLGAPFWFDTLNKFMVVRSTVKPQEKSLDEPSKS